MQFPLFLAKICVSLIKFRKLFLINCNIKIIYRIKLIYRIWDFKSPTVKIYPRGNAHVGGLVVGPKIVFFVVLCGKEVGFGVSYWFT